MIAQPIEIPIEHLLRELTPRVLGTVVRRFRDFAAAEDAVQEASIAAAMQWPREGVPDNPRAWLTRVAFRRMADHARSESARRRRESEVAEGFLGAAHAIESTDIYSEQDDTLVLLFMCCHPALTSASAIALTLRAVGGDGPRCCERFKSNHEKNNHQSFLVYPGVSDTWLRCSYPLVSERAGKRPGKSREISTVDLSESGAAIDGAALSH